MCKAFLRELNGSHHRLAYDVIRASRHLWEPLGRETDELEIEILQFGTTHGSVVGQ